MQQQEKWSKKWFASYHVYQTHNSTYIKLKAANFKNIYHLRHMHPFKSQKVSIKFSNVRASILSMFVMQW